MTLDEKERLARRNDMTMEACAIRLRAARIFAGFKQQRDAAVAMNMKPTTYNNMEKGLSFPSREVMRFFYRAHRIDFNFLINGDFAQLPSDVHEPLFQALADAESEWGRRSGSS